MTVKYASEKAKAEAAVRAATHALTEARIRLDQATARGMAAATAAAKWAEEWPGIAKREGGRPYYRSDVDGMAVHADGEPVWIQDGPQRRRANRPDVYLSPAPSVEEIEALEGAVTKASKALKSATTRAAQVEPEKQKATGYEVFRGPQRISGVVYSPGDPFDPSTVDPDRLNLLIDRRIIRRVGHARSV